MSTLSQEEISLETHLENERYKLALRLSLLLASVFLLMSCIEFFHSTRNFYMYALCAIIPISIILYVRKTKNYRIAYFLYCFIGMAIAGYTLNFFKEEIHYGEMLWMTLIIIMAFWGIGKVWGMVFIILSILNILLYVLLYAGENFSSLRVFDEATAFTLFIELSVAILAIGTIIYQFVKTYKITLQNAQEANKRQAETNVLLSQKVKENEVLLKEVHHRVKNNLQIVISLLRLHKENLPEEHKQKFDEAINRILAMSLIHSKLYKSENISQVQLNTYVKELIDEILLTAQTEKKVHCTIEVEVSSINIKSIVPLGLILNELVTNSLKHAFEKVSESQISLSINSRGNTIYMKYADNGIWKNEQENVFTFGLELLSALTEQLDGCYKRENSTFTFTFSDLLKT